MGKFLENITCKHSRAVDFSLIKQRKQYSDIIVLNKKLFLKIAIINIENRKLNFRYMLPNCKQSSSFVYLRAYISDSISKNMPRELDLSLIILSLIQS